MGIFDSFLGNKQAPATPPAAATPPATPPATQTKAPETPPASPIDSYKDLWQPATTQAGPTPGQIFAGADLTKMQQAAKGVDFSKAVNAELFQKATGGNAEQADALMQLLNGVAQQAYAHATFAATKITDQGLSKFNEGLDARLPSTFKRLQTSESLAASNPELQHPAVAPLVSALQIQFAQKYPTASSAEITQHTLEYLQGVFGLVGGKNKAPATAGQESEDWGSFFDPSPIR